MDSILVEEILHSEFGIGSDPYDTDSETHNKKMQEAIYKTLNEECFVVKPEQSLPNSKDLVFYANEEQFKKYQDLLIM